MQKATGHIIKRDGQRIPVEPHACHILREIRARRAQNISNAERMLASIHDPRERRAVEKVQHACGVGRKVASQRLENMIIDRLTVDALERMLDRKYASAEYAASVVGEYLEELVQSELHKILRESAEPVAEALEQCLTASELHMAEQFQGIGFDAPFSARDAFAGAIAGGGTFGALSLTAHIAANGSNLGAYILVAKVSGKLGLSTAAVINGIRFLGGPTGVGLILSAAIGVIAWCMTDSWQRKLANEIASQVGAHGVREKLRAAVKEFWDETEQAFELAIAAMHAGRAVWIMQQRRNETAASN